MPAKIMGILSIVIKKVAEQASKVVLFGALVGGVSLASYATETPVGPTIEKAQLETVDINLDAVVAAITKVDPDWVKGLPVVRVKKKVRKLMTSTTRGVLDDEGTRYRITEEEANPLNPCGTSLTIPCRVTFNTAINVPYEENGQLYVDKGEEGDGMSTAGNGPYDD